MKYLQFILTYNGSDTTLNYAPDGWDDTMVKWERSTKYWGLFRSFTVQLKFVMDGARILRQAFYTDGVGSDVRVTIKKLNRITHVYYTAYVADVDFATFKDTDNYVEVMLVEGGLSKLIKNRASTIFTFPDIFEGYYSDGQIVHLFSPSSGKWVECWRLINVFRDLVDKITDGGITSGAYAVKSTMLDENHTIVSGVFYDPGSFVAYLETSLDNYYKSVNALYSIGMGIEFENGVETLVIEPLSYFFTNTTIYHFDVIKDFELTVSDQLLFNTVKLGFPEQDYEEDGLYAYGKNEANTYTMFSAPVHGIKNELDLTSKYRGDISGVRDLEQTELTQTEIFFFEIFTPIVYPQTMVLKMGQIQRVDHVASQLFNAGITPRRLLDVHKSFIESCLDNNGGSLNFGSGGNRQAENQTQEYGETTWVNEYDGFTLGAPSLFKPYLFNITVPLVDDLNSIISKASTGLITFTWQGNNYQGFIMDVKVKLSGRGQTEFKLLSAAGNDLTKLIR